MICINGKINQKIKKLMPLYLFCVNNFIFILISVDIDSDLLSVDFYILHIGNDDHSCLDFIRLLKSEGYTCYRFLCSENCGDLKMYDNILDLIDKSENYIIWISSENDNSWLDFCIEMARENSLRRHGCFLPIVFRLNNSLVPAYLEKYEIYELSSDFPCKMPEILEYLKRGPSTGIYCYSYSTLYVLYKCRIYKLGILFLYNVYEINSEINFFMYFLLVLL